LAVTNDSTDQEHMYIDAARVAREFDTRGFAIVSGLASAATVRELGKIYDGMLDGSIPCPGTDRQLGGITRQIMMPHAHHPYFLENEAVARAREIAKLLVRTDQPQMRLSMLIYKAPGHPHETPWHQDMSYAGRPQLAAGTHWPHHAVAQFWVALDDVDETMGCMEFVPFAHLQPMREHYVSSGDPEDVGRLLAVRDPARALDLSSAQKCPLPAGSATVHGYSTPHYTGPNRSATRGRRAFIFNFSNADTIERHGMPGSASAQMVAKSA
jgi:ectoine hydroxylase-related dioxygenase (phytanoyl-CoA dioxygenase family)